MFSYIFTVYNWVFITHLLVKLLVYFEGENFYGFMALSGYFVFWISQTTKPATIELFKVNNFIVVQKSTKLHEKLEARFSVSKNFIKFKIYCNNESFVEENFFRGFSTNCKGFPY